jgi:hypothetical protein
MNFRKTSTCNIKILGQKNITAIPKKVFTIIIFYYIMLFKSSGYEITWSGMMEKEILE